MSTDKDTEFRKELSTLLNRYSKENGSDTPDFILADYLADCLAAFDKLSQRRNEWHSKPAWPLAKHLIDKWEGTVEDKTKQFYKQKLQHGVWVVVFVKADKTTTSMECTLDPKLVPKIWNSTSPPTVTEPEHVLHVYSIDRGGWRSFIVENVKSFYQKQEAL